MARHDTETEGTETVGTRFPVEAAAAMDIARNVGLFKRSRSAFIRDCVQHYIATHSHVREAVEKGMRERDKALRKAALARRGSRRPSKPVRK